MKLAEALIQRKALKLDIQDLRQRLQRVALVQVGEAPMEDPQDLLSTLDDKMKQFEQRIVQINRTNISAQMPDGRSLMEAIAQRDLLLMRQKTLSSLIDAAVASPSHRMALREFRIVPSMDVAQTRRDADALSKQYRELDAQIQALNWATDLIE